MVRLNEAKWVLARYSRCDKHYGQILGVSAFLCRCLKGKMQVPQKKEEAALLSQGASR